MSEQEDFKQAALDYHRQAPPGKIKVSADQADGHPARPGPGLFAGRGAMPAKRSSPTRARPATLTARGNLVAVITNGTAVLGLGNIGPLAGKPVMEGKGVLFQKFAGIDVFDIEIDENDPDKLVDIIASLEPTFGGINLEDIKAPECFEVERKLRERMKIPVFHDDQHGTAIIVGAAIINALHVVGKNIADVKLATSGAGAAGIACLDMLVALGLKPENILAVDRDGVLYDRTRAPGCRQGALRARHRQAHARPTSSTAPTSSSACRPAACSSRKWSRPWPRARSSSRWPTRIRKSCRMTPRPCVRTPSSPPAAPIIPNQVNNALCFPYIFRGALDVGATMHQRRDEARLRARHRRAGAQGSLRPRQRPTAARPRVSAPNT